VEPELSRTIVLAIRKDFIREALLNAVIQAVKTVIPGTMLDGAIRKGPVVL